MSQKYDHQAIEKKWQQRWAESQAFKAEDDSSKPKTYVLDMFPYPSGAGIHLGHTENYTATDIYSRYMRMRGVNVLHPIGWDAFGLPAENYAIKTGVPPQETTDKSIQNFRRQIKALGLSYDWSREVGTHNPDYYRWTQWLFAKFFEKGLVYKKKALVNWDPVDQTVLANEQVLPDGTAERSGAKVEKKELEQWFFKITEYADELHDSLEALDWPESTKINQRNWIGRSEGAEIEFVLVGSNKKIKVFTTRPDTLFGATYMVLAPEHPLTHELAEKSKNQKEILNYVLAATNKSDIERSAEGKEKSGVELRGVRAINPANKEEIPVFIADYVLGHYGTGAIMAVPAHDERDFEFAQKFNLTVKEVVVANITDRRNPPVPGKKVVERQNVHAIVRDPKAGTYLALKWKKFDWTTFPMGGVEDGESIEEAARREVKEETGYTNLKLLRVLPDTVRAEYFAAHKDQNRVSYTKAAIFELAGDERDEISAKERENHDIVWLPAQELDYAHMTHAEVEEWKAQIEGRSVYFGPGVLINSGEFSGMDSEEAKKNITLAVGGELKKTYRLRDWLISRQRYWGAPIPIVYDPEGKPHAVPDEHLPWILPVDVEFRPTGTSPLGQSKELHERTERIFGKGWKPEIDTMDTFACSSWYFFRFADPHNEYEFAGKDKIQKWLPVDLYVGGAEHTVLHLLYARFFTKVLRDLGHISFGEPFLKLRHQGLILASDGTKMSKSKDNVVNPDEVIAQYGADVLRMHIMFMGPLEAMKPWDTKNINGVVRFLERVWKLKPNDTPMTQDLETLLNLTIKKVGEDIESLKLNTAVSALMILLNELEKGAPKVAYQIFLQLLAPFAPHVAHELAEIAGFERAAWESWPTFDESKLVADTTTIAVQVNGRVRGTISVALGTSESEVLAAAQAAVGKWLEGKTIKKALYIKGKIVTLVVT